MGLWFDLWARAFRHDVVRAGRVERDARWRGMIINVVESGKLETKVDPAMFALEFSALLDGLSIQVAWEEPGESHRDVVGHLDVDLGRELTLPPNAGAAAHRRCPGVASHAEKAQPASPTGCAAAGVGLRCSTRTASGAHRHLTAIPGR